MELPLTFHRLPSGASEPDACFVCGAFACPTSGRLAEAELLHCSVCAESYHAFCTPIPTAQLNEETRRHWTCQRCRPPPPPLPVLPMVPDASGKIPPVDERQEAYREATLATETRCARCDKKRSVAEVRAAAGEGEVDLGGQLWVCSDCRCCESCGALNSRSWSVDGLWCSACAPAGEEGRYCGICSQVCPSRTARRPPLPPLLPSPRRLSDPISRADASRPLSLAPIPLPSLSQVYAEGDETVSINCDRCGMWVHPECDEMSQEDFLAYNNNEPGYERYECPDCRRDQREHGRSVWRQIERLIGLTQAKRTALSPDLLKESGMEVGVQQHPKRYAAVVRRSLRRPAPSNSPCHSAEPAVPASHSALSQPFPLLVHSCDGPGSAAARASCGRSIGRRRSRPSSAPRRFRPRGTPSSRRGRVRTRLRPRRPLPRPPEPPPRRRWRWRPPQ